MSSPLPMTRHTKQELASSCAADTPASLSLPNSPPHFRLPHLTSSFAHLPSSRQSAMKQASSAPSMGLYRELPPPGTSIQS